MTGKTEQFGQNRPTDGFFDNLSLPVLIRSGYGLLIGLIVLLLAAGYFALAQIDDGVRGFKQSSENADTMGDIAEDLFEARIAAIEYRATSDPALAGVVRSNINEILEMHGLDAALEAVSQGDLMQEQILRAAQQIQTDFSTMVTQSQSLTARIATLQETGYDAVELLQGISQQAFSEGNAAQAHLASLVLNGVQTGQYDTVRFLLTNDVAVLDAAAGHFEQAEADLKVLLTELFSIELGEAARNVGDLIEQMQSAIPELRDLHAQREELIRVGLTANSLTLQNTVEAILDDLLLTQSTNGDRAVAVTQNIQTAALVAGVIVALIASGAAFLVARLVTGRIQALAETTDALVAGNLDVQIPGQDRSDETGRLARALVIFRNSRRDAVLQEERDAAAQRDRQAVVTALSEGLARMSSGDLSVRMTEELAPDFEALRHDFNATAEQLSTAFADIIEQTENIQGGAANLTSAADDLARRTEGQAAALEETAATIVQLSQSVTETAEGTDKANTFAKTTRGSAENSLDVVASTLDAIKKIQTTSNEVSQIIGVIDDIAFQTNLLALNAGVEAARAGAAGQGFAVVASEVRALAQRSSTAAKEIKQLIETSVNQVNEGVVKADETSEALSKIVNMVSEISDLIGTISAETQSQSDGLKEINAAVSHLDTVTQQNAAMVEETTAASHELTHNARTLTSITGAFKTDGASKTEPLVSPSEAVLDENWIAAQHAG